ncbi:uncharacterized protein BDZ99DRAFT_371732, partial [Mytilinidion resinicola]
IHVGTWTNWSYGSIRGGTVTLPRPDGGLLTAFIALFVTYVGTRFWRLLCFTIHTALSKFDAPQDALYHQRQAVLRNSSTGVNGFMTYLQLIWTWKIHANMQTASRRILPFISFSSACFMGFAVAGIFSSRISTNVGDEVLITGSNNSGFLDSNLHRNMDDTAAFLTPYASQLIVARANYAQNCYHSSASAADCQPFVQTSLPFKAIYDAPCPFQHNMCRSQDSSLILDTGLIDSLHDLGLNTPPAYRFQIRRVLQCAPVIQEGYTDVRRGSNGTQFLRFHYGGNVIYNTTDITYDVQDREKFSDSSVLAIPELRRNDADTLLFFLSSNSIIFSSPIDDLWYSSHTPSGIKVLSPNMETKNKTYFSDDPARVLGCLSQSQICNPNLSKGQSCTPLSGDSPADETIRQVFGDDSLSDFTQWIASMVANQLLNVHDIVDTLGSSSLTSRYKLNGGLQSPLPSNQWQLEVQHWFATHLTSLQWIWVEVATGPSDSSVEPWLQRARNPTEAQMYRSQKVRRTDYTNFSILGLSLTFTIGGLIVIASYMAEPLTQCVQKRRKLNGYARLEWISNDMLQLQRLAHEELGLGQWSRATDDIPVTKVGDMLGVLDFSDPGHPKLKAPAMTNAEHGTDSDEDKDEESSDSAETAVAIP